MYLFITAIILGIVEGLTEFIPVSSTGHLILTGNILGFTGDKASTFEVVIQLGAILAIAILYRNRFFSILNPKNLFISNNGLSLTHIIASMIPVVIVGLIFHKAIKQYLFSPLTVIIGLVVGAIVILLAEKFSKPSNIKNIDKISIKQAFLIGVAQCFSLWPGFSRAGATISGGLIFGLDRKTAAEFSFIVAVPVMVAASSFDMLKMWSGLTFQDLQLLLIGFTVSFIVAYAAVLLFLKLLEKYSLKFYSYYRFVLAAVAYIYFYM